MENILIKKSIAGTSCFFHLFNQQIILENTSVKDMWIQHGTGTFRFIILRFLVLHRCFFFPFFFLTN